MSWWRKKQLTPFFTEAPKRFCVDCRFMQQIRPDRRVCIHPKATRTDTVTGAVIAFSCEIARDCSVECGYSGRWFEPKDAA